ncbi:hypothetical protein NC651_002932 [Populus alba x Populus x berolinensis]|nr:hypothetical protein NC651_002932 [Populus alba x Populus x berolinensis]
MTRFFFFFIWPHEHSLCYVLSSLFTILPTLPSGNFMHHSKLISSLVGEKEIHVSKSRGDGVFH